MRWIEVIWTIGSIASIVGFLVTLIVVFDVETLRRR